MRDEKSIPLFFNNTAFHQRVFIFAIICNTFYFIMAMFLYPIPFSFRTVWISHLGNPEIYSSSWLFNLGVLTTGVLLLYHFFFIINHAQFLPILVRYLSFSFLLIGALGFSGIGIFTDNIQPTHDYIAFFAFVGQGLGLFTFNIAFDVCRSRRLKLETMKNGKIILRITIAFAIFMIFAIFWFLSGYIVPSFEISEPALWEWLAFFGIVLNLLWGHYLVRSHWTKKM